MLNVFLIEDAPRIRSILIEILRSIGNVEIVGCADNERDALAQLRATAWDVAIIDIALREGSGLAVLEALKSDGGDNGKQGVRLVFSNHPSAALKSRALALGAEAFFDKSREMEQLVGRVRILAQSRVQ